MIIKSEVVCANERLSETEAVCCVTIAITATASFDPALTCAYDGAEAKAKNEAMEEAKLRLKETV